jgi:hypothetical protein
MGLWINSWESQTESVIREQTSWNHGRSWNHFFIVPILLLHSGGWPSICIWQWMTINQYKPYTMRYWSWAKFSKGDPADLARGFSFCKLNMVRKKTLKGLRATAGALRSLAWSPHRNSLLMKFLQVKNEDFSFPACWFQDQNPSYSTPRNLARWLACSPQQPSAISRNQHWRRCPMSSWGVATVPTMT